MAVPLVNPGNHRYVYFRHKSRKVCPSCVRRLPDKRAFALCEFLPHVGLWIDRIIFCEWCYARYVLSRLHLEARGAQYSVVYVEVRGLPLPSWLVYTEERIVR